MLVIVGTICCADDRQRLPASAAFTPFECLYIFASVFATEASENTLFAPSVVDFVCFFVLVCVFWSVCGMWKIALCFHKCYVFQLDREKPTGIHANFRNWSRRHHPGILRNKSFSISSQGGCVLAEIAAHGKPLASTFAQGRSRRGDRHDAAACAAYCPRVFCMLKFLITLSCSGRWHTGHHF